MRDRATPETDEPAGAKPVAESLNESARSIAEVLQYVGYLWSAKIDQVRLSVRTAVIYGVLGLLAVAAVATVVTVSVVLLFTGIAHGVGAAMGGRDWLGDLLVGGIVLGAAAVGLAILLANFKTASRRRTMRKYEERRKEQRERFGHDVADRIS